MSTSPLNSYYIHQTADYALGNFIMCTPAICTLSLRVGHKINVFFETPTVADMFQDCPFINTVDNPQSYNLLFTSGNSPRNIPWHLEKDKLQALDVADWKFIHDFVVTLLFPNTVLPPCPHTYVDSCNRPPEIPFENYTLIIRGANHIHPPDWAATKDPGHAIYNRILSSLTTPVVFIGDSVDEKLYITKMAPHTKVPYISIINNIRKSLGAINNATTIIANDTGVYHAARALRKTSFILWKDTPFSKNSYPDSYLTYSQKDNWWKDYLSWSIHQQLPSQITHENEKLP